MNKFGELNNMYIFVSMNESAINVTDSERQWVKWLSEGKKSKEVADLSNLKHGTFAYKMSLLRARFNCSNTASLIATFSKNNLID